MSDKKEIKKPQIDNLEGGEVIYPSSKSSINSIKFNNTTTFSNNQIEKTNYKNKSKSTGGHPLSQTISNVGSHSSLSATTNTIGPPPTLQTISNVSVQGSLSTATDRNNTTSSSTNSQKNPKPSIIHSGFYNNEFKILKNLESILESKADGIEKALLAKQSTALNALNTSLDDALQDIDDHKIETKEELKETRNSVLGTIALFAAFFTFVSVNVNIFTKAENVTQSIIFMLSFWLCIIGFISLFFLFLNKNKDTIIFKTTEFITTASCILLSAGLMYLLFNNSDSESYKKINDKLVKIQEENDSLKKENFALNEKINKNFKALDEQVIELRKNQYQLNQQ